MSIPNNTTKPVNNNQLSEAEREARRLRFAEEFELAMKDRELRKKHGDAFINRIIH